MGNFDNRGLNLEIGPNLEIEEGIIYERKIGDPIFKVGFDFEIRR
jgi:hypothetical protein